jgi:hypothetical protein
MWLVAAWTAVLSVITGRGKWVEIKIHADPLFRYLIVIAERKLALRRRRRLLADMVGASRARARQSGAQLVPWMPSRRLGNGVRAKRSKLGAINFDCFDWGGRACSEPVERLACANRACQSSAAELRSIVPSIIVRISSSPSILNFGIVKN